MVYDQIKLVHLALAFRLGYLTMSAIDQSAFVERRDLLGSNTRVRPGARIEGDVKIGVDVLIDSNTIILGPVSVGDKTYVGSHCVIGHPDVSELNELRHALGSMSKARTLIGNNCVIRSGTTIYSAVSVGDNAVFGHNVMLREEVVVGNGTKLGTNVVVDGRSSIGSNVSIQTGVYVCTYSTVEDGVFLGPCCVFANDKYVTQREFKLVGPTVKRGASIGANTVLFPGIVVGEGAVVGAHALVNKDVPPRSVYAGNPAKKIGDVPANWRSSLLQS
jgi:acetyltransferase-like isoleucine patch superfamily enzyme